MVNYKPDRNPFQLAAPLTWWLKEIFHYDDQLVIMPSRTEMVFRLTRKSKRAPRILGDHRHPLVEAMPNPDTLMMAEYGVIPVGALVPDATKVSIIPSLAARDMWKIGGANAAADALEANEAAVTEARWSDMRSELDQRSGDYYRSLLYRSGQRVSNAHSERPDKDLQKRFNRPKESSILITDH